MAKGIDRRFVKPYTAKHNTEVTVCPECGLRLLEGTSYGSTFRNIYGFADTDNGNMAMVQCPVCFYKWSIHSYITETDLGIYPYFLKELHRNPNF